MTPGSWSAPAAREDGTVAVQRRAEAEQDPLIQPSVEGICIFCRQSEPEVHKVIDANSSAVARFDNYPARPGHVEIIPRRHVQYFRDLTMSELWDLMILAKRVQQVLDMDFSPDGYTIGINDGPAAGQSVPHLHLHMIPRHYDDVENAAGGIRQIFPDCNPTEWK